MKKEYRTIVIGLGGIGSGAAYWLARQRQGDVLGLEQFAFDRPILQQTNPNHSWLV